MEVYRLRGDSDTWEAVLASSRGFDNVFRSAKIAHQPTIEIEQWLCVGPHRRPRSAGAKSRSRVSILEIRFW